MADTSWMFLHKTIMIDFLSYLNSISDKFVLKGGTSLLLCYNLSRFSEDIDLDGYDKRFFSIIDNFVKLYRNKYNSLGYRNAKDTDTVKRAIVHYGGVKTLKIEVSYRRKTVDASDITKINGILVYDIKNILTMKLNAFNHRDKIRDLYDIVFIYTRYKGYLNPCLISMLRDAVEYKGLEQFDYLVRTQSDDLIDNNELASAFLTMYYDLGLQ